MRKITSLATLSLLSMGVVSATAQNFVTDGEVVRIAVNTNNGDRYRNGETNKLNSGDQRGIAKWVSTAIPNLSFVYANGTKNQFKVTATNANLDWNANNQDTYAIKLTGDDRICYRLLGYEAHSTKGKLITVNAPAGQSKTHTFSAQNTDVSVDYSAGPEVEEMSFRNGTQSSGTTDAWTEGTITIRLQKYKVRKVVYVVKEAGQEQEIFRSDSILVRLGDAVLPSSLERPATQLALETRTVDENTTTVFVTATFEAPFDKVSQDAQEKFFLRDYNKHYLNHTDGQGHILTTESRKHKNTYFWQFSGNPYTGVSVKNVANSGYLKKQDSGNNVVVRTDGNAESFRWEVNFNNVTPQGFDIKAHGGFTLKDTLSSVNKALNVNGNNKQLSFWEKVDGNSLFFVEPAKRVRCVVKYENQEVLVDSAYVRYGQAVAPEVIKRPLTELTPETPETVIDDNTQDLVFTATFLPPFDKASQTANKKYVIRAANGYYLNHQDGERYTLKKVRNFPASYQWKFFGNPYTGVSVQNVANNGFLKKKSNNDQVVAQANLTAEQAKWEVNFNKVRPHNDYNLNNPPGGFTLKDTVKGQALNVHGSNFSLTFWEYVDGNSLFFAEEVPEDMKTMVKADFHVVDSLAGNSPFGLTAAAYGRFKPLYDAAMNKTENVTSDEYSEMRAIVDSLENYNLPESGYYRIRNVNLDNHYMTLVGTDLKTRQGTLSDPTSVIYVEKQTNGKYHLKVSSRTLAVSSGNQFVVANGTTTTHRDIAMRTVGVGKGYLQFSGANTQGYLFSQVLADHGVKAYNENHEGKGEWSFERATSVKIALNAYKGKSYATACFPFPVTVSTEGVKAYDMEVQNGVGYAREMTSEIAPGKPMLLVSETESDSVTFTIGTTAPVTAEPTTNSFRGNFFAKDMPQNTIMTLGPSVEDPTKVGFYKFTGIQLPAFRAYFDLAAFTATNASAANGFAIHFGDLLTGVERIATANNNEAIYDLTGRKVVKAVKGLYIINGKKVIR